MTVRFANSLGGWFVSWQSNYGSALLSVAALQTSQSSGPGSWQNLICGLTVRFANSLGGGCLRW
ncbi:MAG: hypothetical protein IPN95_26065 [Bacteroidetes bacterium]|nr:hypothetical protein [Bacteroidota bacterium]